MSGRHGVIKTAGQVTFSSLAPAACLAFLVTKEFGTTRIITPTAPSAGEHALMLSEASEAEAEQWSPTLDLKILLCRAYGIEIACWDIPHASRCQREKQPKKTSAHKLNKEEQRSGHVIFYPIQFHCF
ncbi:hypothetical protein SRHO_G00106400 [Serrasalmus rhombeus]